ncbi:hypothetical protein [Streptomyces sp. CAU 1734]|uniref:hypothetical protein n=1 Tax=Streptomyces sp. CAU 1734 TaxID=3140360 RepID=UPI0032610E3F
MGSRIAHSTGPARNISAASAPKPLIWTGLVTHTDATGAAAVECRDDAGQMYELHLGDDEREAAGLALVAPEADGLVCVCPVHGVSVNPAGGVS